MLTGPIWILDFRAVFGVVNIDLLNKYLGIVGLPDEVISLSKHCLTGEGRQGG
jgi:hypothetical protein